MIDLFGYEILDVFCQAPVLQNLSHAACQKEELHPVKKQPSTTFPSMLCMKWVGTNLSARVFQTPNLML